MAFPVSPPDISISQINFDRVVSIELSGGLSLIIELFREGNLIVVQDGYNDHTAL